VVKGAKSPEKPGEEEKVQGTASAALAVEEDEARPSASSARPGRVARGPSMIEETDNIYFFEGTDYSKERATEDGEALDELRVDFDPNYDTGLTLLLDAQLGGAGFAATSAPKGPAAESSRSQRRSARKRTLSEMKSDEPVISEEEKDLAKRQKRDQKWKSAGYTSLALIDEEEPPYDAIVPPAASEKKGSAAWVDTEEFPPDEAIMDDEGMTNWSLVVRLCCLMVDLVQMKEKRPLSPRIQSTSNSKSITSPETPPNPKVRCLRRSLSSAAFLYSFASARLFSFSLLPYSCLDNSGKWGSGGFFNSIRSLNPKIEENYSQAHKMGDLHLGDVHLVLVGKRPNGDENCTRPISE